MKYFLLILSLLFHGCGGGEADPGQFPVKAGIYNWQAFNSLQSYEEIKTDNTGAVKVNLYLYHANLSDFNKTDISSTAGGITYVLLTDVGWERRETVLRDKYYLDTNNNIIDAGLWVSIKNEYTGEESLSNANIGIALGDDYSWASSYTFSDGAKKYLYKRIFPEDIWIIEPEYCGTNCYGTISLGGGSLIDWKAQYNLVANPLVENGFYWLGMSLFFGDNGVISVYSYIDQARGVISTDATWKIVTINGEEILEMTIPVSVKKEFGIIAEANPIISKVNLTIYKGTKFTSSNSILEKDITKGYFLNNIASEDLRLAFISSL